MTRHEVTVLAACAACGDEAPVYQGNLGASFDDVSHVVEGTFSGPVFDGGQSIECPHAGNSFDLAVTLRWDEVECWTDNHETRTKCSEAQNADIHGLGLLSFDGVPSLDIFVYLSLWEQCNGKELRLQFVSARNGQVVPEATVESVPKVIANLDDYGYGDDSLYAFALAEEQNVFGEESVCSLIVNEKAAP